MRDSIRKKKVHYPRATQSSDDHFSQLMRIIAEDCMETVDIMTAKWHHLWVISDSLEVYA